MKMMQQLLLVLCLCTLVTAAPLFKVFCSGTPVFRGRVDPIVDPGGVSGHSHKVSGGSNFSPAKVGQSAESVYNEMISSSCTTCSIGQVDLTAYWHPDLYYQWPNGTFSLVPRGGLTVYYLSRTGNGDQSNPKWTAFPKGFRMLAGNPYRRSFNESDVSHQAINFACLGETPGPETNGFPTKDKFCKNGLRLQVFFPMCWDGVNLDSPGHNKHVAYATRYNGGNCPASHPVRTPGVFFEAFYSVSEFPHGDGSRQPFVLSQGDTTGYGFHGDFLSGWDPSVMQAALEHPSCDATNTANGNNVKNCLPLAPFVQETPSGACQLDNVIPLTEDLGLAAPIHSLPGCNPLTYGPEDAIPCSRSPVPTNSSRFHLRSVLTGKYVTSSFPTKDGIVVTATEFNKFTPFQIFVNVPEADGWSGVFGEGVSQFWSVSLSGDRIAANRGSMSGWEGFKWVVNGSFVSFISRKNNKFVSVTDDGGLSASATVVTDRETFEMVRPTGGSIGVQNIVTRQVSDKYTPGQTFSDAVEGSASSLTLFLSFVVYLLH
eukprot:TRINITY_DN302_c0_g3_i1.p1 TRINITY_DN302_c0_g3~~TRINITY_DN302_c0_g3_i1.p1  ORF type:complete len:543 (-),score=118.58 TRINITY_DN302_c0_g3_i1:20-1648(-)